MRQCKHHVTCPLFRITDIHCLKKFDTWFLGGLYTMTKMKTILLTLVLTLVLGAALTGCTPPDTEVTTTPAASATTRQTTTSPETTGSADTTTMPDAPVSVETSANAFS